MLRYLRIGVTIGLIALLLRYVVDIKETLRIISGLDRRWQQWPKAMVLDADERHASTAIIDAPGTQSG